LTYFENKALGMSMQYGLSASLYRIREVFDDHRSENQLGESKIYQRIVFLNIEGNPIVDSRPEESAITAPDEPFHWTALLEEATPSLKVFRGELVLVAPFQFKGKLSGHLIAWLSVKDIYWHLVGSNDPVNRMIAFTFQSQLLFAPKEQVNLVSRENFPSIPSISNEGPLRFTVPSKEDGPREMLALRQTVSGTPLGLVTMIPASKLGGISPLVLVAVTGSIGILVVLMGLASVVIHRRALQTMEQLFEKMPFAIVVLTKDRRIGLANDAAGNILACAARALKGQTWATFIPQGLPSHSQPTTLEVIAVAADGKTHAILLTEIPATIVGQAVFLEAFVDQSEIKRLEAQLRQAQKLESVGQLAAGIAHEINTPAQFVQNNISFLSDGFQGLQEVLAQYRKAIAEVASTPEHQPLLLELKQAEETADMEYVEENAPDAFIRSLDGIARIASIVSAMKEFAHPDHREKSYADLNHALRNTLTIAHNEYKFVADVEMDLGTLPLVLCHLSDINQVFLNLVVNAAHAIADVVGNSGAKGRILVRTADDGDTVRVEVHDTGCGIPEAIRDRIFDPFFTTKEVGRGTGQGLAIAHSVVVDKHGGTLTFDSTVGKGSVFTIRLPVADSSNAPDGTAS
jgi:signal transduction histidine kinase